MPANTKISADFKAQLIDELVERLSISFDQKTEQVLTRLTASLQSNNSAIKLATQSFVKLNTNIDNLSDQFAEASTNAKSLPDVLEEKFKNVIVNSEKIKEPKQDSKVKPQTFEQLELPLSIENKFNQVPLDNVNQRINSSPIPIQINNNNETKPANNNRSNNLEENKPSFIAKDNKPIEVQIAGFADRSLDKLLNMLPEAISKPFRSWFEDLLDPLDKIAKKRNGEGSGIGGGFGFPDLGTITKGLGTIGLIGSVLTLLAGLQTEGPLKGVAKIVGTAGLKLILPRILQAGSKLLTKIPFIGSLISIGYAYSRFQSGDYIGAGIDVLSGIANLFPGPGTIIALGLDALNAFLDISGGGSSKEASVKKEKAASGWVGKIIKWGAVLLKKVPFVGTIINLGSAFVRFKNGQIPQGILELGSAVAMLFPGIGTAVSFGIDALTTMLDAREEGQSTPAGAKQEKAASGWVGKVIKWATFALKKIPFVGTIINLGSAYLRFKNNQVGRGILELISAVAMLFPGIGTAVSVGIDALTTILDAKDGEGESQSKQGATQQPIQNPFEAIRKAIVDKAKKWWKGTWDWVKWLARKILPDNIIKFLDDNKQVKEDIVGTQSTEQSTKTDFVSQRIKSVSENLPKERGTSYLTGNVEAHDYLEQLKNLTPTEQQRINAAARLNPEAGHAIASKIIANKQKAPTAKQIDSEDQASKEQGIAPSGELSENKFKYLKGLNFFQRALAFTMQPNLKAQYEKTLSLEQKETNPNILEANKPAIPTSSLPSTSKEVSQENQIDSPIKKLPQWNQQAIEEASQEAERALTPAQPSTTDIKNFETKNQTEKAYQAVGVDSSNLLISSAPQNNNLLTESNQTSNIDSSLLQTIANNTGNSNQNLTMFANGLNQIAKALERVGEAVGEKIKIPPVVVNNSTNSEQKKVSSTEIAKQGNPAIAQFRGAMENLRPIPA